MTTAVVLSAVVIMAYTAAMAVRGGGVPESISATVYDLPEAWRWLFTAVLWVVAFLLLPALLDSVAEDTRWLAFLTAAGVLFVGAAPLVAEERNTLHYMAAAVAGVSSQALVALNRPSLLLAWFPYVCYTLLAEDGRRNVFWAEVACMVTVYGAVG